MLDGHSLSEVIDKVTRRLGRADSQTGSDGSPPAPAISRGGVPGAGDSPPPPRSVHHQDDGPGRARMLAVLRALRPDLSLRQAEALLALDPPADPARLRLPGG